MSIFQSVFDKLFSYKGITLKTNIISGPRNPLGTSTEVKLGGLGSSTIAPMAGSRYLSDYYRLMPELEDYNYSEITSLVLNAYGDFIINYIGNPTNLIVRIDGQEDPDLERVNKYMASLGIGDDIKQHWREVVYWGQFCRLLSWDSTERTFKKHSLINDHTVVSIYNEGKISSHLLVDSNGDIVEIEGARIMRYGSCDLQLVNDINAEETTRSTSNFQSSEILKQKEFMTAMPLYYPISQKVKEYILNELIISLLNIKDLIQPLLLVINSDKNTDPNLANNLARNVENLINKYVDISTIFSSRLSVDELIESIINNIRVIVDYNNSVSGMGTVDMSKLKEKADSIRQDQENRKEVIINSLGLSLDFVQGRSTKWDALKQSTRLNSRIGSIIESINGSIIDIAANIYKLTTERELDKSKVKCVYFKKNLSSLINDINNADITSQILTSVQGILDAAQNTLENNKIIDKSKYLDYFKSKLQTIDSESSELISDSRVHKLIQESDAT